MIAVRRVFWYYGVIGGAIIAIIDSAAANFIDGMEIKLT
jgi:hypothetical protein